MSNESLHEIERDVEHHRAELSGAINELQQRFSPEALVRAVADGLRDHGGDMSVAIGKSVQQNPVALALTGVGLAWMVFGRSYDDRPAVQYRESTRSPVRGDDRYSGSGYRSSGYADPDRVPHSNSGTYQSGSTRPSWLDTDDSHSGGSDNGPSLGERASDAAHSMGERASGAAHKVGDAVGDAVHGIEDRIAGARDSAADSASHLRDRLYHGTEHLTEAARERIAEARHRAMEASRAAAPAMRKQWQSGRDTAVHFFEDQPLIAGALALAVGAAIASALPRTKTEDDLMGEQSDYLIHEAERIFEEEAAKAMKVGKAALREAGKIVEEKGEEVGKAAASASEVLKDEAREAASRVKGAAASEAEHQGLTKAADDEADKPSAPKPATTPGSGPQF
ncbi:MAG: DUF3618 domain-containing protein [Pararhodobacter sp.]